MFIALFSIGAIVWSIVEFRQKQRLALAWALAFLALVLAIFAGGTMLQNYQMSHNIMAVLFGIDYD